MTRIQDIRLSPTAAQVLLVLDDRAMTAAEIVADSGGLLANRNTVWVTLERLARRGLVERDADGWAATEAGDRAVRVHQAMVEEAER
jgi:DNA-binding IclR family transcriptional regulator